MSDERRNYRRYMVWFPVTFDVEMRQVFAICRDASPSGLLVSATMPLALGATVLATFRLAPDDNDGEERQVAGRVVRIEPAEEHNPWGVWPYRMAVEFEEPIADMETPLKHASERPPMYRSEPPQPRDPSNTSSPPENGQD